MKRVLLMAVAAMLLFTPAANAQKVNASGIRQKLEKSDAEINDAKKNVKAATWISRGKSYFESIQEPTKQLYPGLEPTMLKMVMGVEPKSTTASETGEVWEYEWVNIHLRDGRVVAWEQTKEVYPGAIDVALEALLKAHELDPKQDAKIKGQLESIVKYYRDLAGISYEIGRYDVAQNSYVTVGKAQTNPAYGAPDYENFFFAGQLSAYLGATDASKFAEGEAMLKQALDAGYTDEEGNIYYYLFHCYYGQKDQDPSKVMQAKEALLEGIEKFPKNERILDGLMSLYTTEEGVGDPADLISLIDKSLADDPTNADLWFGRGRVYYKLGNYDECINSFAKVAELKPDSFDGNFYLALFYQIKGETLTNEINKRDWKSQSEYSAAYADVIDLYKAALPWYEKALTIDPTHVDTVDNLKMLYFRLRDEGDEYLNNYNKYNTLSKQLKGLE